MQCAQAVLTPKSWRLLLNTSLLHIDFCLDTTFSLSHFMNDAVTLRVSSCLHEGSGTAQASDFCKFLTTW